MWGSEIPAKGATVEFERTVLEADVVLFAALSGDRNPLHVDPVYASSTHFGQRLVHGAFLIGLVSAGLTALTGPGYVYLGQQVRFRAPVYIGDTVTVRCTVAETRADKPILSIETTITKLDGTLVIEGSAGLMLLSWLTADRTSRRGDMEQGSDRPGHDSGQEVSDA
jgi:3-hydroxybutyryl-CoA dehydratase